MTETVSLYDAKTHLSQLVERAAEGEEIMISKNGKPWRASCRSRAKERPGCRPARSGSS